MRKTNVRTGWGQSLLNKGFTLIELLAVIVILAIIALIATPIILGIIKDSKEESNKRSAELYIDAVEQAIVRKNLNGKFKPNLCEINSGVVTCDGKKLEVEVPDTLSSRSVLLIAISMFDIALGIGILTYVKKNKLRNE